MKLRKISIYLLTVVAVAICLVTIVPAQQMPAPQKEQLLNGLRVLLWPDAKADKTYVNIRIHAGAAFDPQGKEGTMQLLADSLFPNPATKEFFSDDLGGSLEISTTYDYIQISASMKPESFLTGLETLATAVSSPQIEKDTTVNFRNVLAHKLREMEAEPGYLADREAAKRLLGSFPYGRSPNGTPLSLQTVDFADLIGRQQFLYDASHAISSLIGIARRLSGA